ncbi:pyridoxamine 5'-phosphate oxidase family protein [Streptomyces sp. NPDC005722]
MTQQDAAAAAGDIGRRMASRREETGPSPEGAAERTGIAPGRLPHVGQEPTAAPRTELVELGPEECWALLSTHGVGRIGLDTPDGLAVLPVNYTVTERVIAFRTDPGATPAAAADTRCAFEVDHVDEALSQGWSVLVRGLATAVTDPPAVRGLAEHEYSGPWAGGDRTLWVRVVPTGVTGRRITSG